MSTLIVEVCEIERIDPHTNADALELAQIKGWQCVVPKSKYRAGQRVVYVPIDSMLPLELSEQLSVTKYLSKQRVRCAKLRGEPSFGLIMDPTEDWPVGTDVKDHYGITKYVPPLRAVGGNAETPHPLLVKYTELENLRNFPDVLEEGEEVVITEKIHGTNCKVALIEGEEMAGSMTVRRKRPEGEYEDWRSNIYWFPFTLPGVRKLLAEEWFSHMGVVAKQIILFGEVFGSKIQNLNYGKTGELGFRAFDMLVDGNYVDSNVFKYLCNSFGVDIVPELYRGPFSLDIVKQHAGGKTTLGADHIREGVVVKPTRERIHPKIGRVALKYISDEYLLMKEGGRVTDTEDA